MKKKDLKPSPSNKRNQEKPSRNHRAKIVSQSGHFQKDHQTKDRFFNHLFSMIRLSWRRKDGLEQGWNLKIFIRNLLCKNFQIKILSFLISLSIFGYVKMQDIAEEVISIKLKIVKNEELEFVVNPPEKITLFLSGTKNSLTELDVNQIYAKIDLTDIDQAGDYTRAPNIEGLPPLVQIINFIPPEIDFQLSTLERKLLPIEPELVGSPNRDFELKGFKTTPRKIWISGPKDILHDMTKLVTEPISIQGLKSEKETEAQLTKNIHPNINISSGPDRKIKVNIFITSKYYKESLQGSYFLNIDFGDNDRFFSDDQVSISNVEYQIKIEEAENFYPDEKIKFYVDARGIKFPGEHTLTVKYAKVEGLRLKQFSPKKVTLEVKALPDDFLLEEETDH